MGPEWNHYLYLPRSRSATALRDLGVPANHPPRRLLNRGVVLSDQPVPVTQSGGVRKVSVTEGKGLRL